MRYRRLDARRHAAADRLLDRRGLLRRAHRDGLRPRRPGRGLPSRRPSSRRARSASFGAPSLITRTTNDVQQVQMLVLMSVHDAGRGADHVHRRHRSWRCSEDIGLSWLMAGVRAGARRRDRADHRADGAAVPAHAGADRRGQPGAARADHRHPRGAGVRPGAAWRPRASTARTPTLTAVALAAAAAAGADVPDRHARAQRVERRGAVVRRRAHRRRADADRRAHRVPGLPACRSSWR